MQSATGFFYAFTQLIPDFTPLIYFFSGYCEMIVTYFSKIIGMKKFLVALVLAAGIGAIAYASLSKNSSNKQAIDKKEKKKECQKKCLFS